MSEVDSWDEALHDYMCSKCDSTFDVSWNRCPKCGNKTMIKVKRLSNYDRLVAKAKRLEEKGEDNAAIYVWKKIEKYEEVIRIKKEMAGQREEALDYEAAIEIWEELGELKEAARVRRLKAKQGAVNVAQNVVHGDNITEIKDSVLNRSSIGAGGKSKAEQIGEIRELLDAGAISEEDYQKMKREIVG
jgi:DNA-directed RNA polymerase subunit RPC12/RpoP